MEDRTLFSVTITSSTTNMVADSPTIVITGTGFDPIVNNNSITFTDQAVGTITSATSTTLDVEFTTDPTTAGSLNATVTSDGASSASTQVATVIPDITSSAAYLAANAGTLVINGFGFDTNTGNDGVTFNDGAVGTVQSATATALTVDLGTDPSKAESLTATVTVGSTTSAANVQVATVQPVVTGSIANLTADSPSVTIHGFGFDTTQANDSVYLDDGAAGSVTGATNTSITYTFSTAPTAGALDAIVSTNGISNGAVVQIATVQPTITSSSANVGANVGTITIDGAGFDTTAGNNHVTFSNNAVGTVTAATPTALTVTYSTPPTAGSDLTATVTTDSVADSTGATQVATILPVVTSSTANLADNATTLTIYGYGFDTQTPSNNVVMLSGGATDTIASATATSLTLTLTADPTTAGSMTATVTTDGEADAAGAVQVATVTPVVTASASSLAANAGSITIHGSGFDTTAANDSVAFSNGAMGMITNATHTALTVTITVPTAGNLTAVVTTDGASSGAAVRVAVVTPVVTANVANSIGANAATLTIQGYGFDPTPGNNSVTLSEGAGTVTAATATTLTVTFTTLPPLAADLTAGVTTDNVSSATSPQVATVIPVVTSSTASLGFTATQVTFNGYGFDTTPGNNTVTLSDGAAGTVTGSTSNSITVTFSTNPTNVGSLTAQVTTDTNFTSSGNPQVATVVPVVLTNSGYILTASTNTVVIVGAGFDTGTPGDNTVVFNDGAVGTVGQATANTLTVNLSTTPTTANNLYAVVTTDTVSSGAAVQVATVKPVVTSNNANLPASATSVTISGAGFDPIASHDSVSLNEGTGSVTAATATSLTVTFTAMPTTAGNLTAVVTTDGASSGLPTQVAKLIPAVTTSTANLAANATGMTINGYGFDTTAGNNLVTFTDGAVGTVTSATANALTVSFITKPRLAGSLTASVTTDGVTSGASVQVATVAPAVVSNSHYVIAANATPLVINGFGFDATTATHNTVQFSNGASGTVASATATSLTVTMNTAPTAGTLTAIVTTDGVSSGSAVTVATVVPVVTSGITSLAANASSITINGSGFDTNAANDSVTFSDFAVGTVESATATSLTVSLGTDPTTAGILTAYVTTDNQSSGTPVQVATVIPAITASTAPLATNATSMTIDGYGFDTTPGNNSVSFADGAVGAVTAATATTLTVAFFTDPPTAGSLTATVTTDGNVSSSAQVAAVQPVVTASTASLAANATSFTINGFGFDTNIAEDSVTLSDGATGTVSNATATALTVSINPGPTTAGSMTATVTTDGVASTANVQVATITPVVTSNNTSLPFNATSITINGYGFDSTAANDSVTFNDGVDGTVASATATSLTVNITTGLTTTVGELTAIVTTDLQTSGAAVQVATIAPVVTSGNTALDVHATTFTITGLGFDANAGNDSVTFQDGATGSVTAATSTSLTVEFLTDPTTADDLTAMVTTDGVSNGSWVTVADISTIVTPSTASQAANTGTITINGFGFDTNALHDSVTFTDGAVGNVTQALATSLSISFTTDPATAGPLSATVTVDGVTSSQVQVATITPVVTLTTTSLAANATTLTITGYGFDPTAANDSVTLSDGAVGSVGTATATSLTVTLTSPPTAVGTLTAMVTDDGQNSGSAVQVATVIPVVTSNTATLAANATTLTIDGVDFDATTATDNVVTFNNGALGTVASATSTALTVTITAAPIAGNLTASVSTDGNSSGTPVQVATITPVVTSASASLAANAGSLIITGVGFDPVAANDSVVLSNGATGTVASANNTTLHITLTAAPTAGNLTAQVTTDTQSSVAGVQVATVAPVVTAGSGSLALNGTTLIINGVGFSATALNDSVSFNDGAVGSVTTATTTSLLVTLTTAPSATGTLTAVVTSAGVSSASNPAVNVATVVSSISTPTVTSSTASLAANATTVTIAGHNFDTTPANNRVTFSDGAVGSVTTASATSLTVTFSTKPATAGSLAATVVSDGVTSGSAVQVATVTPVVTSSTANLAANSGTITINGFGFDTTAGHNTLTFNDGAVGTVQSATATTLTVSLSTKPTTAGNLTLAVTTDSESSGTAVTVATVIPVITSSTATLGANATTITIAGFGFDSTAAHNTVSLSSGAGSVTTASATSLTVTFSTKPSLGNLTASVITDTENSGSAVQVATVAPVVTMTTTNLAANAGTVTITGAGFDTTAANNLVSFNDGAVGTVMTATATSLTVTLSTKPTTAGSLTAEVTTDSQSNGSMVQVATVTPVVTSSNTVMAANTATITINGFGFDANGAHDSVVFNNGAVGSVTTPNTTSLVITFSTKPTSVGNLTAVVTTDSASSGTAVQVATVTPVVTTSTASLALTSSTITIAGVDFDPVAAHNTVSFTDGAVGTVSSATSTSLTVTFSTKPTATGSLTASVTTDSQSSGTAVQVATVTPVVTSATTSLLANATTITIAGAGFDSNTANDSVTFNDGAVGTVQSATATSLTVSLTTKPTTAGALSATVMADSRSSGAMVQVATVKPVVTSSTTSQAANASTITINGFGFDTTAAHNTIVFSSGAVGTVTQATATTLTVSLSTKPTIAGSLTAIVTTDSQSSGTAVQVANVTPVVSISTAALTASANTLTITGSGFDPIAAHNLVTFTDGAVGTVTSATATSLTVTFSTRPVAAGSLTVTVTTDGVPSAAPVQVATIAPVVTNSSASISPGTTSLVISGLGFDPTAANDTVTFNNGAIGTVQSATATTLTISFSTAPSVAGHLNAVVVSDGLNSGSAVEVANVT